MQRSVSTSFLRRATLAAGVLALGIATFAPSQALASVDKKATIDTHKSWDGTTTVQSFGCPNTTTYGETVTVPAGKSKLVKFDFYMNDFGATGSMVVRGEVYAWNGTSATGSAVAETKAKTLSFGDSAFHKVTFKTKGANLTAGSQYVLFASIDKDYEACTDPYTNGWGSTDDTAYPGGTFVFLNSGGDESQWTTSSWTSFGIDLAFQAYMK